MLKMSGEMAEKCGETIKVDGSANLNNNVRFNKYVLASAVLASMNSILLGYDIGVMSGAILYIKDELKITSTQVEVLIGSLNVCSLIGSLAAGRTSDWIGRRYTIVLASATFLLGALLMGFAPSFPFLMAGRVVAGIGVGYSLMIAPVYTAELSPATSRGFLTSLPEVFINVGILMGYVFNYAFADLHQNINWRIMLGIAALPAVGIAAGVTVMPESPRWLVMQGRLEEAKRVLLKTTSNANEAEMRFTEITAATAGLDASTSEDRRRGRGVWRELLLTPTPPVRRMLLTSIGLNFFMQASGNDAIIYYTPEVFKAAGIHGKKKLITVSIAMGFVKTCFVLLSACFLDRFGRRPMLLLGATGIVASLTGLGIGSRVLEASPNKKPIWAVVLCVIAVCSDVSFFSIGLGPITWVYSSEIFPTRVRAQASSMAIGVNRAVSGTVAMTFLSISKAISFGYTFFIFAGISFVGTVFFYWFLPETKGKSLEEMETLFENNKKKDRSPIA